MCALTAQLFFPLLCLYRRCACVSGNSNNPNN